MTPRGDVVAGIFVGGKARRMGGHPKGLLRGPSGDTLVGRWRRLFDEAGVGCVLVGAQAGATSSPYASEGVATLEDEPAGIGPLGGLVALLAYAGDRSAIAVACDMPFVSSRLLVRLMPPRVTEGIADARLDASMGTLAPRPEGRWEPFFARYDAPRVVARARAMAAATDGTRSLRALLDDVRAHELPLDDDERRELRDWDSPEDIDAG